MLTDKRSCVNKSATGQIWHGIGWSVRYLTAEHLVHDGNDLWNGELSGEKISLHRFVKGVDAFGVDATVHFGIHDLL